jgi:hypothetical protein
MYICVYVTIEVSTTHIAPSCQPTPAAPTVTWPRRRHGDDHDVTYELAEELAQKLGQGHGEDEGKGGRGSKRERARVANDLLQYTEWQERESEDCP